MITRKIAFNKLRNISDIANHFGCDSEHIEWLLAADKSDLYQRMQIPKKNKARAGEFRVVYKVKDRTLSLLQKNLATVISSQWKFPEYVQGFVKDADNKRSIATNAALHLGQALILKADILDFFDSISTVQVIQAFKKLGCNDSVAEAFAGLCALDGFLPQGSSTSPILSNLVCEEMDAQLDRVGRCCGAAYSRYADDITFSGATLPERRDIEAIFEKHGFDMHPDKFLIAKRGRPQFVTGLSVFDKERPRVPRKMKRSLRQELFYMEKYGIDGHLKKRYNVEYVTDLMFLKEGARITGWVDFMASIEPDFGEKVKRQWADILGGRSKLCCFRLWKEE